MQCYFDDSEIQKSFEDLINDKDYNFSRYNFFLINYLLHENNTIKAKKVMCIPINRVKKGDKIVVGKNGIRVRLEYDDQWKHSRIKFKQTLADCAVDGIIPTKKGLATPKQVAREAVKWLESMQ